MRSAVVSTITRTASTCGSSMVCTPMKCGPTTFQCMCFSVRARSFNAFSRSCSSSMTSCASSGFMPGTVKAGAERRVLRAVAIGVSSMIEYG